MIQITNTMAMDEAGITKRFVHGERAFSDADRTLSSCEGTMFESRYFPRTIRSSPQ